MIAITGASGHLGKNILDSLLSKTDPQSLVAIARDPQKIADYADKGVQVRQGDYVDFTSLVAAFAGVDKLLLVSSSVIGEERVQQHTNVINAAKEAGVTHIFYTSATNPSPDAHFAPAIDHFKTENLLKESGLAYTIFRNNLYLDVLPGLLADAPQSGKLHFPAGQGKVSFALRADMAEAIANALIGEGHENKVYDLGAPTAWSFADVADALSHSGTQPVEYIDIPNSAYETELAKHVPPAVAKMLAGMAEGVKQGDFNVPDPSLEKLLGRQPVDLAEFIKGIA